MTLYGVPRRTEFEIERRRIGTLLDASPALVRVVGGRGSGKTVAVAAWARHPDHRGAWIAVDPAVSVREVFWNYTFGLVEDAMTDGDQPVPAPHPVPTDLRRVLLRWAAALPTGMILVIDGVDRLERDTVADLLWLADVGGTLRIVLVGRRWPIGVEPDGVLITPDVLRLTPRESAELLRAADVRVDGELANVIGRATDGSARELAAVARRLRDFPSRVLGRTPNIEGAVTAAVERAVLGADDVSLGSDRTLLAHAALLETVSVDDVVRLTGAGAASVRAALDDASAFGWGRWEETDRFAFAPVVARALTASVRRSVEHRALLRRAGAIALDRDDILHASILAIDARDFDSAIEIGSRGFVTLLTVHSEEMLDRLAAIPLPELAAHPLIVLFIAVLHAQRPRGRVAMLAHYAWADRLSRRGDGRERSVDRAMMLMTRSIALRLLGRERWAAEYARSSLAALDVAPAAELQRIGVLRSLVLDQGALALFAVGDLRAARELAVRSATGDGAVERARAYAWSNAAYMESVWGDMRAASERLDAAGALQRHSDFFFRVPSAVAELVIAAEEGRSADARDLLVELGGRVFTTEYWPTVTAVRAGLLLAEGQGEAAIAALSSALIDHDAAPVGARARDALGAIRGIAHLAAGEPAGARAALRLLPSAARRGSPLSVMLRLAAGEPVEAVGLASGGLQNGGLTLRTTAALTVLRAAAANRIGSPLAARRDVRTALELFDSSGLRSPWIVLAAEDRAALTAIAGDLRGVDDSLLADLARIPVIISDTSPTVPLTARERTVLARVAAGLSNAEIGDELGISPNTVRKQRASAYRKLGASTRERAIATALDRGQLDA